MDTVYPAAASALTRGRRGRRELRPRRHTQPVTFAEIKEVDEESEALCADLERRASARRRPDVLRAERAAAGAGAERRRARSRPLELQEAAETAPAADTSHHDT